MPCLICLHMRSIEHFGERDEQFGLTSLDARLGEGEEEGEGQDQHVPLPFSE